MQANFWLIFFAVAGMIFWVYFLTCFLPSSVRYFLKRKTRPKGISVIVSDGVHLSLDPVWYKGEWRYIVKDFSYALDSPSP